MIEFVVLPHYLMLVNIKVCHIVCGGCDSAFFVFSQNLLTGDMLYFVTFLL